MSRPGNGVLGVALALIVAILAGTLLSRSLLHSGASRSRATEAQVVVLFNQQRAAHGLAPLRIDAKLGEAADAHSAEMLRRGYFAHDDPQSRWDVRIRRYVRRREVGEILSYGSGQYATPSGMVRAWMRSPRHRRVILTPELRLVGVGVATGTYHGQGGVSLATADFSSS
jgi:uncharacterized protein YkwD